MQRRAELVIAAGMVIAGATGCSLADLSGGGRDSGAAGASAGGGSAGCAGNGCSGSGGTGGSAGASCDGGSCLDASAGTGGGTSCAGACAIDDACVEDADCKSKSCAMGKCSCPSGMVYVPTPIAEGVSYCVDLTEVTNEQYDAFLKTNPDPADQPEVCAWNTSLLPSSFDSALAGKPKHPVVSLDWCDARAYCAAVGKRLCGKLGGGSHLFTLPQSATNEWYVACSEAGKNTFVYGNTHDPYACVAEEYFDGGAGTTAEVGTHPECQGGYPGIVDMNGNVWEWEDSCNDVDGGDAAVTVCRRRGGSFGDTQYCARCSACGSASRARNNKSTSTGFRCCAG